MSVSRPESRAWLPGLELARSYQLAWLRGDLVAGVVLTAMLVPAGMAYAELAGLPAVTGLDATIVPLVVYAVFGPSSDRLERYGLVGRLGSDRFLPTSHGAK